MINKTELLTNPLGIDFEVQTLQVELAEQLIWLEHSFGRAFLGTKKQTTEGNYTYPAVYVGDRNYYDASPNDKIISQSFFDYDANFKPVDYQVGEYNKYVGRVNLIVWGNLNKVNLQLDEQFGDEHFGHNLLLDTLRVIRSNRSFKVVNFTESERGVFDTYSVRSKNPSLFYHPYFCFKITLDVVFEDECYIAI